MLSIMYLCVYAVDIRLSRAQLEEQLRNKLTLRVDVFTEAWYRLHPEDQSQYRGYFRSPEALFREAETNYFLQNRQPLPRSLTADHIVFKPLHTCIQALQTRFAQYDLSLLIQAHQRFITQYCAEPHPVPEYDTCMTTHGYYAYPHDKMITLIGKDAEGRDIRKHGGNHVVSSVNGFHCKRLESLREQEYPAKDFLCFAFFKSLGIPEAYSAPTLLLCTKAITHIDGTKAGFTPGLQDLADVQAHDLLKGQAHARNTTQDFWLTCSPSVTGESLEDHLKKDPKFRPTRHNYSWHVIATLLLRMGDAKADNYMVQQTDKGPELVAIDGEDCLHAPLKLQNDTYEAGLKSILFCMDDAMLQPLDQDVQHVLLNLDPQVILFHWRLALEHYNAQHTQWPLFTERQQQELNIPYQLMDQDLAQIRQDLHILKDHIRKNSQITHHQLLDVLHPDLARYYAEKRERYPTPLAALNAIYHDTNSVALSPHTQPITSQSVSACPGLKETLYNILSDEHIKPQHKLDALTMLSPDDTHLLPPPTDPLWQAPLGLWHAAQARGFPQQVVTLLKKYCPQTINDIYDDKTLMDFAIQQKDVTQFLQLNDSVYRLSDNTTSRQIHAFYQEIPDEQKPRFVTWLNHHPAHKFHLTLTQLFPLDDVCAQSPQACTQHMISANGEHRTIHPHMHAQVDPTKNIGENRPVYKLTDAQNLLSLHMKFLPELPGIEEAVSLLTRTMIGFGAPQGELMRYDGHPVWLIYAHKSANSYPSSKV